MTYEEFLKRKEERDIKVTKRIQEIGLEIDKLVMAQAALMEERQIEELADGKLREERVRKDTEEAVRQILEDIEKNKPKDEGNGNNGNNGNGNVPTEQKAQAPDPVLVSQIPVIARKYKMADLQAKAKEMGINYTGLSEPQLILEILKINPNFK